jgi:hypothetical protein
MNGAAVPIVLRDSIQALEQGDAQTVQLDKILQKDLVDAQAVPLITSIPPQDNCADNVTFVLPTNTGSIAVGHRLEVARIATVLPINISLVAAPGSLVQAALDVLPTRMALGVIVQHYPVAWLWQATMVQGLPHIASKASTVQEGPAGSSVLPTPTLQEWGQPTSISAWLWLGTTGRVQLPLVALVTTALAAIPDTPALLAGSPVSPLHLRAPRALLGPLPLALGFPCVPLALRGS